MLHISPCLLHVSAERPLHCLWQPFTTDVHCGTVFSYKPLSSKSITGKSFVALEVSCSKQESFSILWVCLKTCKSWPGCTMLNSTQYLFIPRPVSQTITFGWHLLEFLYPTDGFLLSYRLHTKLKTSIVGHVERKNVKLRTKKKEQKKFTAYGSQFYWVISGKPVKGRKSGSGLLFIWGVKYPNI